jgi:hypothetical protein
MTCIEVRYTPLSAGGGRRSPTGCREVIAAWWPALRVGHSQGKAGYSGPLVGIDPSEFDTPVCAEV